MTTATAVKTPQNKRFYEQKQQFCTCVLNFVTFRCHPLQNIKLKWSNSRFCWELNANSSFSFLNCSVKALVNEDTLLPMMFLGLRKLGNICWGHKMFLNKIRNIFCVPDTKFVSATNVARAGKRGNICVGNNVSSFARALTPTNFSGYWVVRHFCRS